jgi:hydrogenase maturation protease
MAEEQRLIIGYGNTLRQDDGAGYRVAEAVASWELPGVRSHPCHQLTPELAIEIAAAAVVIFVDAALPTPTAAKVQAAPLQPALQSAPSFDHTLTPAALLWLSQTLYHHCPTAHLIAIPSQTLDFGEDLSPIAQQGVAAALEAIRTLV